MVVERVSIAFGRVAGAMGIKLVDEAGCGMKGGERWMTGQRQGRAGQTDLDIPCIDPCQERRPRTEA